MQALVSSVNLCESQFFFFFYKKGVSKSPPCFPLLFVLRITERKDLKKRFGFVYFCMFVIFLATSCSMWDLSSLTRD